MYLWRVYTFGGHTPFDGTVTCVTDLNRGMDLGGKGWSLVRRSISIKACPFAMFCPLSQGPSLTSGNKGLWGGPFVGYTTAGGVDHASNLASGGTIGPSLNEGLSRRQGLSLT